MRFAASLLVVPLFAPLAGGQGAPPPQKSLEERLKMPVVYTVPGMDQVESSRVIYRRDANVSLEMDVYVPPHLQKGEARPAVLFLHGGASLALIRPTDWGVYQSYGRLMGASGLVGVTFNQRIGESVEKGFADTEAAIAYVRTHAAELHIDAGRLCLSAYSAGGPLLAIGIRAGDKPFRCLVNFYGVLDLKQPVPPESAPFSPVEQLKLHGDKLPPMLIARAGQDSPSLNATIDRFITEALAKDAPIEVHNLKGAPHAFDIQTPTPEVRAVIARTIAFLKANLE